MATLSQKTNDLYFLAGGGEMGELIRATDWSNTPLGDPSLWPQSLRTIVAVMLDNPFGMYIAWGKEYIQLYNDGYRPILGATKHPQALGISTRETFSEIWYIIGSMFDGVMEGRPVGFPNFMLPLNRNGFVEECYFDFSYSPIRKEDGEVGGVLVTVIETTSKKKAEDALKDSEKRFRAMADNIPNLAWMANADGGIYWYNKKWYEYTGTNEGQMLGEGWHSVHDPLQLPKVLEKWQRTIDTGKPFEMIFPIKGADGKFRQFLTRVLPVYDNEGKITQWFGSNTDITAQIETEQNLKESEERFRTMAEGTDILIATSDETGNATYFNTSWTVLTGRTIGNLLDIGWADLIHDEDREAFGDLYKTAFESREDWKGEFRMLSRSGEYRCLIATGIARFLSDGSFAGYISSGIDITERKNAEEKVRESARNLRQTIIQAPVAMCILKGPQYIVELANARMYELWGKPSAQIHNKPIFESLPEAKDQGLEALLDGVYTTGVAFMAEDVPLTLPRGDGLAVVYVNFVYEAYREVDGTISGILAVAVEVTDQYIARQKIEDVVKKRTKELEDVNYHLQRSNAELAQFAYIASHDLQEPLRKISTFAQMLEHKIGDNLDADAKNYLDKINNSSARMNTLIRDVLTYSELTKETEVFSKVDLTEILKGVFNDYELLIDQKGASFIYKDLPVIQAIPLQMSQLFSNLVGNALKFSRQAAPPVITISSSLPTDQQIRDLNLDPATDYCMIQVADNGIGFKKEYADRIFNIFQRLHRKSEYEGTGIGLAMCKKIALNHRGELNASGSSESGAVFNIILPLVQQ